MANNTSEIQKLYIAYFNRPADSAGLNFWLHEMDVNGVSLDTVQNSFSSSPEYQAIYTGHTNAQLINLLYQNLFGRDAEPAGLLWWLNEMTPSHTSPVQQTIQSIASVLSSGTTPGSADNIAINDKIAAATAFTAAIDTTPELLGYDTVTSTPAAFASASAWLSNVKDAATLATALAGVNAALAAAIAANPVPGLTFTLTPGADLIPSFTGGAGNDTFTAADLNTVPTWTTGDAINGGGGTNTFNVITAGVIAVPVSATVTNIQTANLTSGSTVTADTTGWTGLTALNTTSGGTGAQTITAAATTAITANTTALTAAEAINGGSTVSVTNGGVDAGGTLAIGATTAAAGAVTVSSTSSAVDTTVQGTIDVTGGTTVSITQVAGNAVNTNTTGGAVTVTGNASTTAVTVNDTVAQTGTSTKVGRTNGTVTIADVNKSTTTADTITTVTLNGYGASTIDSTALTTLNLGSTGGTLGLNRTTSDGAANATTLNLTVAGGAVLGAISGTHAADFTTVNLVTTGTTASTIADVTFAAATTLAVSGTSAVTLTANTGLGLLTTVTSGAGGLTMGTILGTGVLFTGGTGADSIGLGATTRAITMGGGNDTVVSAGLVGAGGSVDAGVGDVDTIVMTGAQAATAGSSSTFNTNFTNFEALTVTPGGAAAINLAGVNNVSTVNTSGQTGILALSSFISGGTINLTGAKGGVASDVQAIIANAGLNPSDIVNVHLTNTTAAPIDYGTVTAASVETINIVSPDAVVAGSAAAVNTLTLVATGATNIVVTGNNGLTLVNTGNVAVTTFDAHGVVANGSTDTAPNLAVSFLSANTDATKTITITGGAGNDVLAGNATTANVNIITGGEGADTITSGLGNDTINLTETTAAIDTVVFATTASNGIDTITGFAAGAGADLAKLVAGATTNVAQAVDGVADFAASTNTTLTNGAAAFVLTGGNTTTDDIIAITATLSSFGNLGLGGVVDGTELLKALSSTNVAASSITANTAGDNFYVVAYQSGNAYLYQVTNNANTAVIASEIALVAVFSGVAAGAFAYGDFITTAGGGGGGIGSDFTLTPANDTFIGGVGNDTFTGTFSDGGTNTFNIGDTLTGNGGIGDTLQINPNIAATAITLDDTFWTHITGIENIVFGTTTGGAQAFTFGNNFNTAFTAGVHLTTNSTGGSIDITMGGTVAEQVTLTTTSTGGIQTIATGSGAGLVTVDATSTSGGLNISGSDVTSVTTHSTDGNQIINVTGVGTAVVTVNATSTTGTQSITTGAGNDIIGTVSAGGTTSITGGAGRDAITLGTHTSVASIVYNTASLPAAVATDNLTGATTALAAADTISGFVPGAGKDTIVHGNIAVANDNGAPGAAFLSVAGSAINFNFKVNGAGSEYFNFTTVAIANFTTAAGVLIGIDQLVGDVTTGVAFKGFVMLHDNQASSNGLLLYINDAATANIAIGEIQVVGVFTGLGATALVAGNFS